MNRRGFLAGILASGVAPYVSTMAGVLMPVRSIVAPDFDTLDATFRTTFRFTDPDALYIRNGDLNEAAMEDVLLQLAQNMRRTKEIASLHSMTFIEPTTISFVCQLDKRRPIDLR